MARQLILPETEDCQTYWQWLVDKTGFSDRKILADLFMMDFETMLKDDENREKDGLLLRKTYANEVGKGRNSIEKDRIWKSIHGKCSCLELILGVSNSLNDILNEENESMVPQFFEILMGNLGIFSGKSSRDCYEIIWKFMSREYNFDGKGGLFPLKFPKRDQRLVPIWYQMNYWMEEHSDQNGAFTL